MSRIETRNNATIAQAQASANPARTNKPDGVASSAAMQRVLQLSTRRDTNRKVSAKKQKKLHAASDISNADLQPLLGKKRDDVIGDLSRILVSINELEAVEGEDETTRLCKMMIGEHVRRLMMIEGTEIVSDGLKGFA